MKYSLLFLPLLACSPGLRAQTPASDTTVYQIVETLPYPLIQSCQAQKHPGWTEDSVRNCSELQLIRILSSNIRYPETARQKNTSGTVVTAFIVEKDGRMGNFRLLKDIGDGCGNEALRVLKALDGSGLRWQPARQKGIPVRMEKILPLRFRLEEPPPFLVGPAGDTVYTSIDSAVGFRGGLDSLVLFVIENLNYPADFRDSCRTGIVEMALLVRSDGTVRVENQLDYNNLGFEFQYQAIRMANKTAGRWAPAMYGGKPVGTTFPLRVAFKSPSDGCAAENGNFDKAMLLADEGARLAEASKEEEAIEKWTEALNLHPNNTELLYYRGNAYFSLNRRDEACRDFNQVKKIIGITWFESLRRLLCGW